MLTRLDCSISSISPALVVRLARSRMRDAVLQFPRLACALWKTTLVEQAIAHEWLVNVGQRTAFSRAAHLLCEMFLRLRAVGLAQEHTCEFPLTQTEIADTLALSTVHVNRTLMELRRSGLITLRDKQLTIHHLPGLEAAAGFNRAYLHLEATLDDEVNSLSVSHGYEAKERKSQLAGDSAVADIICGRDWSRTPLGPIGALARLPAHGAGYLPSFHIPHRGVLGTELITLYNDVCARFIGDNHPCALGAPAAELFADIWDTVWTTADHGAQARRRHWLSQPAGARQHDGRYEEAPIRLHRQPDSRRAGQCRGCHGSSRSKYRTTSARRAPCPRKWRSCNACSRSSGCWWPSFSIAPATCSQWCVPSPLILSRSRSPNPKLEGFFERLSSLGRVQGLISRAEGERVKLADIVWAELEAYAHGTRSHREAQGVLDELAPCPRRMAHGGGSRRRSPATAMPSRGRPCHRFSFR